jgi:hypothetical protein
MGINRPALLQRAIDSLRNTGISPRDWPEYSGQPSLAALTDSELSRFYRWLYCEIIRRDAPEDEEEDSPIVRACLPVEEKTAAPVSRIERGELIARTHVEEMRIFGTNSKASMFCFNTFGCHKEKLSDEQKEKYLEMLEDMEQQRSEPNHVRSNLK